MTLGAGMTESGALHPIICPFFIRGISLSKQGVVDLTSFGAVVSDAASAPAAAGAIRWRSCEFSFITSEKSVSSGFGISSVSELACNSSDFSSPLYSGFAAYDADIPTIVRMSADTASQIFICLFDMFLFLIIQRGGDGQNETYQYAQNHYYCQNRDKSFLSFLLHGVGVIFLR